LSDRKTDAQARKARLVQVPKPSIAFGTCFANGPGALRFEYRGFEYRRPRISAFQQEKLGIIATYCAAA